MSFFNELKRRNVFKVGIAYVVVSWFVLQVADVILNNITAPDWVFKVLMLFVGIGFPFAVMFAWAFEMTPEGLKRESEVDRSQATPQKTGQTLNYVIIAVLVLALAYIAFDKFVPTPGREAAQVEATTQAATKHAGDGQTSSAPAETLDDGMSIAVMPLVNMSSVEENEYFAGGIHEDVLTNLSRISGLQVVSRTSMLRYATSDMTLKQIGNELGVDYIVEGSVRRIGNHVRVTIQLINAHNDLHLWANNFERELVDVFATQSELAKEITDSLHLELQPASIGTLEGMLTFSVKAYDLYIKAASLEKTEGETQANMVRRRGMLEEAVTEDPDFVEAWAELKRLYDLQLDRLMRRDWYLNEGDDKEQVAAEIRAKSKRALDEAIALDPNNAETLLAKAVDHAWPKTEEEMQQQKVIFDQIIEMQPDNAKAWYHLGHWYSHLDDLPEHDLEALTADAAAAFEEALRLDPFNARMVGAVLSWYRDRGYQEDVTRLAERLNQIIPETAADRRLARVSWSYRRGQIEASFRETADESWIEEYRHGWQDAIDSNEYATGASIIPIWNEARLSMYDGDLDRVVELSNSSWNLSEGRLHPVFFSLLKAASMDIFIQRGDLEKARLVAQVILENEEIIRAQDQYECVCYLGSLARANAFLGNMGEARRLINELVQGTGWDQVQRIRILGYMDAGQATDVAFAELANNPNWTGFDEIAVDYLWYLDLLAQPRIQEYYLKEGKWINYLSARVPEYAKYSPTATE